MNPSLYHQARHRTLREVFVNEDGAIDLASIMVGIIVIGLIGGVIAATIFAVIPWAQDNAAKQQLDSVSNAENAYRGLAEDAGISDGESAYGAVDANGARNQLAEPVFNGKKSDSLLNMTGDDRFFVTTTNAPDSSYTATITSASGKIFTMTNGGQPHEVTSTGDNGDGGYNGGGDGGYNGGGGSDSGDTGPMGSTLPTIDQSSPLQSSYKAALIAPGTGSNADDGFTTVTAADMHENQIDGKYELQFGSNSQTDTDNYAQLLRYADVNSQQWDSKTGVYPNAQQFQGQYKPLNFRYIRVDSVTLSDREGQVGETYTPSTGSTIQLIEYPYSDGTGDYTWVFNTVLPSDFSETNRAIQQSNWGTLTATVVVDGKTITFHP